MTDLDQRARELLAAEFNDPKSSLVTRSAALRAIAAALRSAQPASERVCWRFVGPTGVGSWQDISLGPIGAITEDTKIEYAYRAAQPAVPKLNIRCETESDGVKGSTYLNVIAVNPEDDGSFTVVTDHWPQPAEAQSTPQKPEPCSDERGHFWRTIDHKHSQCSRCGVVIHD